MGLIKARKVPAHKRRADQQGHHDAGEDCKSTRKRDGRGVDFTRAGIVHQAGAATQSPPPWQRKQRCQESARERRKIDVERKTHDGGILLAFASFK